MSEVQVVLCVVLVAQCSTTSDASARDRCLDHLMMCRRTH